MHVAAVVVHEEDVDSQALLQSVKRFLRNAFVQVEYENVSVILSAEKPARRLGATKMERHADGRMWMALAAGCALVALMIGLFIAYTRRHGTPALKQRWKRRLSRAQDNGTKPVDVPAHG